MRGMLAGLLAAATVAVALTAQGSRHELGLRLRAFERHLAAQQDAGRRDAAFVELERAVQAFFRLDMARVGAAIDAADLALAGATPSPMQRFARSLQLRLGQRLVDAAAPAVSVDIRPLYDIEDAVDPDGLTLAVQLPGEGGWKRRALEELPMEFEQELSDLPPGDHMFRWRIENGDQLLAQRAMAFGVVADLAKRLDRVFAAGKTARKMRPKSAESATLVALANLLRTTQRRAAYETELRGAQLLDEAERLVAWLDDASGSRIYDGRRPGSFRVHVPVGGGTVATRLFVPEVAKGTRAIVVALHGAGGSENLFFDGYGDGLCVALAKQRGWFVVSPRNGPGFVNCAGLVDALAERYPIDTDQVFVVGHSMGAMQTMRNVSRSPERFHAVAPIAGGGRVRASDAFAKLPFFVSAGERDFGLQGARRLHRSIQQAGAQAIWRVYPAVEHLAIVQIALPDVFSFFDQHAK